VTLVFVIGSRNCRQQPLKTSCISGSLHAYPHADSSLLQLSIKFLCFSIAVVQFPFITLASLLNKKPL
jgi:hypothetical protein